MASIFNQELTFWKKVNKLTDAIILNVLFLICCIPIVTFGPACSALYYSLVKSIRKNRGYAVKNFFHSFVQNLRQGIPSTIIFGLLIFLCCSTIHNVWDASLVNEGAKFTFWIAVMVLLFVGCMLTYFYAVLSRFNFSFKNLFMFTILITFRHFLTTIGLLCLLGFFAAVCWLCIPIFLIIGVAGYTYMSSFLIEGIFMRYMPKFEKANPVPEMDENGMIIENGSDDISDGEEKELTPEEAELMDKDQWYYE